jgi:glycosyltransferase involved in cell wall biosynthesis
LFPSIWPEPIARSVMEAMAAELLVIGSEVGGQVEMMRDGENALTFTPGNAAQLAEHIRTALREPARVEQIAAAGRATVLRDFDVERTMLEMESWLESIVSNEGGMS